MIKLILEKYIQKTKNKDFKFDDRLTGSLLIRFLIEKMFGLLRSFKFYNFSIRGKVVFLGKSVQLFNRNNISLGNNVTIGDYVKLSALGSERLLIGNNVNIGSFSQVIISISFNNMGKGIKISDNVAIGEFSYIGGAGGVCIGKDTIIGQYFSIHPENHNYEDPNLPIRMQGVSRKGIVIGENCWIGSKVTILDGVTIGNNTVIAAGSVVTKSFGDNVVLGGVPAKVIKNRIHE